MVKTLLVGAALAIGVLAAFAPGLGGRAPGEGIRLGVCDWTIGKSGDPAALEFAAKLGLEGVQVSLNPEGVSLALVRPELRRVYLSASERTGVAIASFAMGELNNVPLKSDPRAEKWLGEAVDIAHAMGVKIILVPFFGKGELRNDAPGVDVVVKALQRLAPRAERAGVVLALESYLSAEADLGILERVPSAAVRIYYDVANAQAAGYTVVDEIRRLGPRIVEIHAKDTKGLYGRGSMDFVSVRKAMDEVGYRGWLVIEGTEMPLGLEKSLRYDVEYLRSLFTAK